MIAAYYLNPRYQYRPGVGDDGELIRAVHNVFSKLDPDSPQVGQFGNEVKIICHKAHKNPYEKY